MKSAVSVPHTLLYNYNASAQTSTTLTQCLKSDNIVFFYSAIPQIPWIHLKIQTDQGQAIFESKNCTSGLQVTNTDISTRGIVTVWSLWNNAILFKGLKCSTQVIVKLTWRTHLGRKCNGVGYQLPWWSKAGIWEYFTMKHEQ